MATHADLHSIDHNDPDLAQPLVLRRHKLIGALEVSARFLGIEHIGIEGAEPGYGDTICLRFYLPEEYFRPLQQALRAMGVHASVNTTATGWPESHVVAYL